METIIPCLEFHPDVNQLLQGDNVEPEVDPGPVVELEATDEDVQPPIEAGRIPAMQE